LAVPTLAAFIWRRKGLVRGVPVVDALLAVLEFNMVAREGEEQRELFKKSIRAELSWSLGRSGDGVINVS